MSYNKSYANERSSFRVEDFLKAIFGFPEDCSKNERIETICCPWLVKVKAGDGIGFVMGDFVAVTNSKGNIQLVQKANYEKPFEPYKEVQVSQKPIRSVDKLEVGKSYLIEDDGEFAFVKYVGNHSVFVRCDNTVTIDTVGNRLPVPFYELSVSKEA